MIIIVSIDSLELLESDEAKCFMNYEIQLTSDGEDLNTECKGFLFQEAVFLINQDTVYSKILMLRSL